MSSSPSSASDPDSRLLIGRLSDADHVTLAMDYVQQAKRSMHVLCIMNAHMQSKHEHNTCDKLARHQKTAEDAMGLKVMKDIKQITENTEREFLVDDHTGVSVLRTIPIRGAIASNPADSRANSIKSDSSCRSYAVSSVNKVHTPHRKIHSSHAIYSLLLLVLNSISAHFHQSKKLNVIQHVLFTLCVFSIPSVSAQTWSVPPEDRSEHLGNSTRFTCGLTNLNDNGVIWYQFHHNGTFIDTLFINSNRWTDNGRYSVMTHSSDPGVTGYDLLISDIEQYDDKVYECDVQDFDKKQATLTVLVAPGYPIITVSNEIDLEEGDNATLTCSSSGGNPLPVFTWFRNGQPISGAVTVPGEKFGTARSVLSRILSRDDNGAMFRCQVINEAVTSPRTADRTISVKYAPVLDVGEFNPLVVVEQAAVTLECTVDANPPVTSSQVTWLRNGQVVGTDPTFSILGAAPSDAGEYTCRATNDVGTTDEILILDVHYGPQVSIQYSVGQMAGSSELRVNENQRLNLTCDVTANPEVDLGDVEWRRDGVYVKAGASLYLNPVLRSDSGLYSCHAANQLQPSQGGAVPATGSAQLQVSVLYAPGAARVTVPEEAISGETVVITCTMDDPGYPEAELTWTREGYSTILDTGPEHTFDPIRLADTGEYTCSPTNEVADGTPDTAYVTVFEYTEWLDGGLPNTLEHTIEERGVSLVCAVRGKPAPTVTWYKDGDVIDIVSDIFTTQVSSRPVEEHSFNVTSTLSWRGSGRYPYEDSLLSTDSGYYTCSAKNDIDVTSIEDNTQLSVYYAPVLNTSSEKVAIDPNQDALITCGARSLPETSFSWRNGSVDLSSGGRISISNTYDSSSEYPYMTILTIRDVTSSDFSVYTCVGSNDQGASQLDIQLTVKTVPDSPTSLGTLGITWESVELEWQAGFDGGYTQHFTVTYTAPDTGIQELDVGAVTRYNVTHLYPDLNYTFRVRSQNQLGSGAPSNVVAAETDDFEVQPLEDGDVTYDENTHTVTFTSPNSDYCARIDIKDDGSWFTYLPCEPTEGGSVKIDDNQNVDQMRIFMCLETRPDVCSDPTMAAIVKMSNNNKNNNVEQDEDLPTYVVIVIGVICAVIVLALTLVLIYLCYKRRQSIKKYEEQSSKPATTTLPANGTSAPPPANGDVRQLKSAMKPTTYDNPNLDNSNSMYDDRKSPVFTTQTSQNPDSYETNYYQQQPPPNGHGFVTNGNPNYSYENQHNLQRERSFKGPGSRDHVDNQEFPMTNRNNTSGDKQYLHLEDPYRSSGPRDSHNNSGEGSMGSDQNKPKKVMYEVVV